MLEKIFLNNHNIELYKEEERDIDGLVNDRKSKKLGKKVDAPINPNYKPE